MTIKILNLYAGIGGNRKLWGGEIKVVAIENNKEIAKIYKDFFPQDEVIVCDAHQYLLDHYKEFDFIWSSPPCPSHSRTNTFLNAQGVVRYPDMRLYEEIIFLKQWFKGKWVVENVIPYYEPLIKGQKCGRHLFWTNFKITNLNTEIEVGTFNRNASKNSQRKMDMKYMNPNKDWMGFNLRNIKIHNKRQILRNCVNPNVGLHVFELAFKKPQLTLQ